MEGRFAAGEHPATGSADDNAEHLGALAAAGIDCFIDLTEPGEGIAGYSGAAERAAQPHGRRAQCRRYPITDMAMPASDEAMIGILDAIDAALAAGSGVYVHCWGGIGRTGTVVGCWLVRHGLSGGEALDQIGRWWQHVPKSRFAVCSPQTDHQRDYVLRWDERPHATSQAAG